MQADSHGVGQQFHQLPMFMTAREIRSQYQALDTDRHPLDPKNNEESTDFSSLTRRDYEDDDQLFDRKYAESYDPTIKVGYRLADSILRDGVKNPVSLQVPSPKRPGRFELPTASTGMYDKPQILGGHHRVAVMDKHRPHDLMPVAHFEDTLQAKRSLRGHY